MTGSKNTVVRKDFSEDSEWRDTLGNKEPLLAFATTGYCLDAPERIPAGSMLDGYQPGTSVSSTFSRYSTRAA